MRSGLERGHDLGRRPTRAPAGPRAAVNDAAGKIIGLLTRHALGEMMIIRAARPDWRFDRKA
jgi:hypothetical protein